MVGKTLCNKMQADFQPMSCRSAVSDLLEQGSWQLLDMGPS